KRSATDRCRDRSLRHRKARLARAFPFCRRHSRAGAAGHAHVSSVLSKLVDAPMPALNSQLDPRSQEFIDNATYHRALVEELDRRLARAADGGGEQARGRHAGRGKLPARERITALLDPGSPFL